MTAEPDLERRVTRLENDTTAIYDLVSEIRTTVVRHDKRLTKVERTLDQHTQTLDKHTRTLNQHTERFDHVDESLAEILRRLPEH